MSVLVCIPTAADICSATVEAVFAICANHPGASFRTFRAHPIDRCRNICAKAFVQSRHTHLLFLDSDTVPPTDRRWVSCCKTRRESHRKPAAAERACI